MSRLAIVLGLTFALTQPLAAQSTQQVGNLRAFAKLYGYVRWFHPSDEAAALDWDAFAAYGAERAAGAGDASALRRTLTELFQPIAPTVRITADGEPAPRIPELEPTDTSGLTVVAWQHLGLGSGNAAGQTYRSTRIGRGTRATGGQFANLAQRLDGAPLRGREVRFTGLGRSAGPGGRAQLWLRVDRPGPTGGFFDNMGDRPATSTEWTPLEIRGTIDADAERVVLGTLILGSSGAEFDELRLEVMGEDGWEVVPLENPGFEAAAGSAAGTVAGWLVGADGWNVRVVADDAPAGAQYLAVTRGTATTSGALFPDHPRPGDAVHEPLGSGLNAHVPLALWSRDGHTLGAPPADETRALADALAAIDLDAADAGDRALRLADVVILWNVFQHFYPYWDVVDGDWDYVLTQALERALADESREPLMTTLRWMVSRIEDGHGLVHEADPVILGNLGVRLAWVEERVVVVATHDASPFRIGDVIVALDGVQARDVVEREMDLESGTERFRRWRALGRFALGDIGSVADVRYERDGALRTARIARQRVMRIHEPRPDMIEEIEPGIFYVDLERAPMDSIRARIEELAAADGVVFDLRGYPAGNHDILSHLTDEPIESAHWMVPRITRPDGVGDDYEESRWLMMPAQPRLRGNVVFLTDRRAISYAESVLGIVEHYRLGEIVGEATAGANGNVNPIDLPGGYVVRWTGMRVVKHDRTQHHLVGIQPTIPAAATIAGIRAGRDEVLERGIEVLRNGVRPSP